MLVTGMVNDEVKYDPDTAVMETFDEVVHIIERAVWRVDVLII